MKVDPTVALSSVRATGGLRTARSRYSGATACPIVHCGGQTGPVELGADLAQGADGPEIVLPISAKSRRWSASEVAELRRLSHGAPPEEIAAALGRTVSAVRTKAAQKRILLRNDAPRQGPPRLMLPWEADRRRP